MGTRGGSIAPPIDEAVGLLATRQPHVLAALRERFPDAIGILQPGMLAGEAGDDQAAARLAACLEAVTVANAECLNVIGELKRRLAVSQRIAFSGKVVTIIGGASVLTTLANSFPILGAYVGGALSLVGGLAPILAEHMTQTVDAAEGGLSARFRALVEMSGQAGAMQSELERWTKYQSPTGAPDSLVGEANSLCMSLKKLVLVS